jgi:hypothetical protein
MSQINTGHRFVPLERNIDDTKLNGMLDAATVTEELISTQALSTSAVTGDHFLLRKAAGTLGKIVFDDLATSLVTTQTAATNQLIWNSRLRSFNAVGNPNFEVTQFRVGASIANPANGTRIEDRWFVNNVGPLAFTAQVIASPILLPGTSFAISNSFLRLSITTAKPSLASGDLVAFSQSIEGPLWRELSNDVHSVSLLVRSSVAVKFGLSLRDSAPTKSLTKLCTYSAPGTWVLIPLPNLPVWPAGNFTANSGAVGYILGLTLAGGATFTSSANDTWQTGNLMGAIGQDNFFANSSGATFDIAFVQHEPGSQCTTPIDKPFTQNYDECLRYLQKSYEYPTAIGLAAAIGQAAFTIHTGTTLCVGPLRFHKPLAKSAPTVTLYNHATGTVNSVRDNAGTDHTGASASSPASTGFNSVSFTTALAAAGYVQFHYTADTGW